VQNSFIIVRIFLQLELHLKRQTESGSQKPDLVFPLEVMIGIPCTILLFIAILSSDRSIRFRILYPMTVSIIGVLSPMAVIMKNKKMKQFLVKLLIGNPLDILENYSVLFRNNSVSPIQINI
jgi:hypothetical protein